MRSSKVASFDIEENASPRSCWHRRWLKILLILLLFITTLAVTLALILRFLVFTSNESENEVLNTTYSFTTTAFQTWSSSATTLILTTMSSDSTQVSPTTQHSGCSNGSTFIDFDDLSGAQNTPIPNGYYGLNWMNVHMMNARVEYPSSGYVTALTSGQYVAFNANGNSMSIVINAASMISAFSINSFIAAAAWNNNLRLAMTGERSRVTVYSTTIILQTNSATNVILDWNDIDKITFTTSGGVNAGLGGGGTHFAMDNLCITV